MKETFALLGYWKSHEKFLLRLEQKLLSFLPELEQQIRFYSKIQEKVYILNLDNLLAIAKSRYSFTGRVSQNQSEIFRVLVVMTQRNAAASNGAVPCTKNSIAARKSVYTKLEDDPCLFTKTP